jgi:hypothetical protein
MFQDQVNISTILNSTGPIVQAVLLSANEETPRTVEVDTTPKKQMVQQILGGPFTFLGQYEDEGIVLIIRRDQETGDLPTNTHKLQPPFHATTVKGDILALKVAPTEEDENINANKPNEEFFLNYTCDEYEKFAARTDITTTMIPATSEDDLEDDEQFSHGDDDEDEMEGEYDSEDEEKEGGFMDLLLGQVLQRFEQENGRMPDKEELQALEAAIAAKLGGYTIESS